MLHKQRIFRTIYFDIVHRKEGYNSFPVTTIGTFNSWISVANSTTTTTITIPRISKNCWSQLIATVGVCASAFLEDHIRGWFSRRSIDIFSGTETKKRKNKFIWNFYPFAQVCCTSHQDTFAHNF